MFVIPQRSGGICFSNHPAQLSLAPIHPAYTIHSRGSLLPKMPSKSAAWLLLAPLALTLAIPPTARAAPNDSTKSFKAYQKHLRKQDKKTRKAEEKAQKRQKKLHPTGH
jgi:hypothetical protein